MPRVADRKGEIIDKALNLIAQRGIEKLTFRNLAAAVGISEPAFYRHFSGKSAILLAILDHFDALRRELFERIRRQAPDSLAALEAVFREHLSLFARQPALAMLLFPEEIRQNRAELEARVSSLMRYGQEQIAEILAEGKSRGEIRADLDPEQAALIVSGSLRLLVGRWRLGGRGGDLEGEGRSLARTLVGLMRAPSRKTEEP